MAVHRPSENLTDQLVAIGQESALPCVEQVIQILSAYTGSQPVVGNQPLLPPPSFLVCTIIMVLQGNLLLYQACGVHVVHNCKHKNL